VSVPRKTRELTGKHVLFCLLGFFGVVFAVNAVMVKAATSTFGGVETSSSYKAGLMFKQDVAAAEQQEALHWQVSGKLARNSAGQTVLDISARDAKDAPIAGLTAQALNKRAGTKFVLIPSVNINSGLLARRSIGGIGKLSELPAPKSLSQGSVLPGATMKPSRKTRSARSTTGGRPTVPAGSSSSLRQASAARAQSMASTWSGRVTASSQV